MPKIASWIRCPGLRPLPITTRLGAFQPAIVLSRRSRYRRCPPSSTTAIAPPALRRRASAAAAVPTALAPSSVSVFFATVWATAA